MGRNDLLTVDEVAEILGVSTVWVHKLTRDGILRTYHPPGQALNSDRRYRPYEIEAYKQCRGEGIDIPRTINRAIQAEVRSVALERRVEQLEFLSGLNVPTSPRDGAGVRALVQRAEEEACNPPVKSEDVMEWGHIYLGLHEEFFELVERYVGHPKPWDPFFRLGQAIRMNAPVGGEAEELKLRQAHGYFNIAYRVLRQASWFYIESRHGRRVANREIPGSSFHERVLRHIP